MILGNFLIAIATILDMLITLYIWVIIIAAIISWVGADPYNPIVQLLNRLTQPLYAKIRAIMPTSINGIDLCPLIVGIALQFIKLTLVAMIIQYARSL